MKDLVFIYDTCCIYEITNATYFLNCTGCEVDFVGLTDGPVKAMEGYSMNVDYALDEIDFSQVRSLIIPGGNSSILGTDKVKEVIRKVHAEGKLVAAICSAVDVVEDSGVLEGMESTHSTDRDWVLDKNILTARANAYVDFAIEIGKYLDVFEDEADLQETINFWKYFKRV